VSTSGKLWVRFFHRFEGFHREVALWRPFLAAPQDYLRGQRARARLAREHSHHSHPPLHPLEETLQHVRPPYPGVVRTRIAQVAEGILHPHARQKGHARHARPPVDLQIRGVQIQVEVPCGSASIVRPAAALRDKQRCGSPLHQADLHSAQGLGDPGYLARRDPTEVHLQRIASSTLPVIRL
jgi:hypothetical protein